MSIQALTDASLLRLSPTVARALAASDVRVAAVFLTELSERVQQLVLEIPDDVFMTVPQRLARHLLDLASARIGEAGPADRAAELVVTAPQRELAEAAGTVREVWSGSCGGSARPASSARTGTGSSSSTQPA
ncbi:Crp/Fnr family transcriptional regulator [Georgenia sp. AZ-5]|uniref:Crp/Fnr family transcriptional regulator n=1 Tax=Georgenia sp. AZ-5 TaxID=3367526 RepID=UPI003754305C